MKKSILYLIFLGLLFSNSQAHAIALSQNAKVKVAVHKTQSENNVSHRISKKRSFSHKADILNDYEDDFDEYDGEDYNTTIKGKLFAPNTFYFNSNQLTADCSSKLVGSKIYTVVNFSRLPRFNYISLRVLRL